ncbi:MAG: CHAD domain-containing protein [Alphaproteobacteria bacterium]|nr:CHAD domain-containing protein [Alphaproteobacteria bacterium]
MRSPGPAFDLRAALTAELRAAIDELDLAQSDVKAVHRCRVRVKRARALARVGRACAPGLSSVFVDSARTLMRNLALARDPAALSEAARSAAQQSKKRVAVAFETVARGIDEIAASHPSLNLESARAGMKDLLALAQVWPEASHRQIRRGAKRLERRARRARRRGLASFDPVMRHRWRMREKDRFFAASMLGASWPGKARRKTAEKVGVALGGERDALLLMERLVAEPELAGAEKNLARALKTLNKRRSKLARRADRLAMRLQTGR